jgi:hypothetical protein
MKKLLTWGGTSLLISAFLDPLIYSGMDKPIPWLRDLAMAAGGMLCLYLLVKYRNQL